jgi:general stress protein 26
MSAKRENGNGDSLQRLRAFGAFAGGTPAVPANHLSQITAQEQSHMIRAAGKFQLIVLLLLFAAPAVSAQDTKRPLSRAELITAARETMSAARYCALITQDSSGRPQARTLDPFPPDENMVVWLGTNPRSRKVAAIRRNPRVTLYYFDREAQAYVTIYGIARLINDPKAKLKWWKDEWKDFYPNRTRDFLLIRVTPEQLEVVNVTKGIVGDPHTWKPPTVKFGKRK